MRTSIDIEKGGYFTKYFDEFCSSIPNKIEFINISTSVLSELDN